MAFRKKEIRVTMATGVEYDARTGAFITGDGVYTSDMLEALSWVYINSENKLLKKKYVNICADCDSEPLYDEEEEEFYCPVCN